MSTPATLPGSLAVNRRLDQWLRFNPDRSVTVYTGKVEIGQGVITAMAQIAAEELDVALSRVRVVAGDTVLASRHAAALTGVSLADQSSNSLKVHSEPPAGTLATLGSPILSA